MILSEILTYVKDNYTYDSDIANSLGEAPTDTQLIPYVNWAVRTIARKTRQISIYIPITLVAGQGSYNLNAGSAISSTKSLANSFKPKGSFSFIGANPEP